MRGRVRCRGSGTGRGQNTTESSVISPGPRAQEAVTIRSESMADPTHTQITTLPLSLDLVSGPDLPAVTLTPDKVYLLGRSSTCDIQLADKAVSRSHLQFKARPGGAGWQITDLGSKHGTFHNGVKLEPNEPTPLRSGDLLSIDPWTFRARLGGAKPANVAATTDAMAITQRVTTVQVADLSTLAQQRLALLIDSSALAQNAATERELAETVLTAALQGTGFARGAVLRRGAGDENVEVIASLPQGAAPGSRFSFSRSLIREAGKGEIVSMTADSPGVSNIAVSIVSLNIEAAVCAPIFLGSAVDAYLYLDAREGERAVHSQSAAFCKALARMYGTALGNLKRLEVERMRGQLKAELEAAGLAQKFILPEPSGALGRVSYSFKSRPGRFASGDLFDVVEMPDGKVGMFLGDVAGKGAAAAIVMAVAQTHLRDMLATGMGAAEAMCAVNRYIAQRNREGQFITLFLAVIDPTAGTASCVDAGHGYWMIRAPGAGPRHHDTEGNLVIGVEPEFPYAAVDVAFPPGARLVVCSDGVIEQCNPLGEQFGRERALETIAPSTCTGQDVETLVQAVLDYAQTDALSDDVTAGSVEVIG